MTRTLRSHLLGVAVPFIAILITVIAVSAPAQTPEVILQSAQHVSVSVRDTETAAKSLGSSAFLPYNNSEGATVKLWSEDNSGSRPMDGDPLFVPAGRYEATRCCSASVAIGNLNGDGKRDLAVANLSMGNVDVLLGQGDGTFLPAVGYDSGGDAEFVAIADVNGDGHPDLVAAVCAVNCHGLVAVLRGAGDGTFRLAATYNSGGFEPRSLVVTDVNGDGKPDVVVSNLCISINCSNEDGTVIAGVLLGNGDGTFKDVMTHRSIGNYGWAVATEDLNLDGKPDLQITITDYHGNNAVVSVSLGNGDGTFQPATEYSAGGSGARYISVADLNRDGYPDLIVSNFDGLAILLGNGDGSFQGATTYDAGGGLPTGSAVVDVNADGKLDVVLANDWLNAVVLLLGNGDGTFQGPLTYDSGGAYPWSVAVGDMNGDDRPDVAVTNLKTDPGPGPGVIGVLLNNKPGPHSPTATTLASLPNPSVFGETVTITAQVSSDAGTPTGMVKFFDGSQTIEKEYLVDGKRSISMSTLGQGSHSITAAYQGSLKFSPSTSSPITQVVNVASTTTSLSSSANPVGLNQKVKYTATVNGQYGGSATGTITFYDGSTVIAKVTVGNNQASYSTTYTSIGVHTITATYSGDANNAGSTSAVLKQYVAGGSKTTVTTSGTPTYVGQTVTLTAKVISKYGTIPDGELVTFYDGTKVLSSVGLAGGMAAYTTSSLSAKTHTIKATYIGDNLFFPSTGKVQQIVLKYLTTTTLTSSPNPSNLGEAVTFTATVTPSGPYALTGTVKFWDGTMSLGSAKLKGGVATLTKSTLVAGTHAITAKYLGDAYNDKSTSPVVNQVVQ